VSGCSGLCEGQDVEELDVETGRGQAGRLRDPVPLLETEHELLAEIVRRVELVEAERERRRLLARGEEDAALDVVRTAEVVTLAQRKRPALARSRPVLDRGRVDRDRLVDVDLDGRIGPLFRRVPGLSLDGWHEPAVPADPARQT
jgi:hypothetical protein